MNNNDLVFDGGISKKELEDAIKRLGYEKLVNAEDLYALLSRNPNFRRYDFIKTIGDLNKLNNSPSFKIALRRLKAQGIQKIVLNKMNSFDNIILGGKDSKSTNVRESKDKKERKSVLEVEV